MTAPIFIGMRAVKCVDDTGAGTPWQKGGSVKHFNLDEIKIVDEKTMLVEMKNGVVYRIDDESLQIFLSANYGEHVVRGDKLSEDDDGTG